MAKAQIGQGWGVLTTSSNSITTTNLNSAASGGFSATWWAGGFIPLLGGTVSKIRVWINAVTGTLVSGDLVCDIYSDSNGNPGSSLQSSTTVTSVPTGAAWVEFTGFSTALTIGTQYWIVIRNADATPTTNSFTCASWNGAGVYATATDPAQGQGLALSSTNSGSTWSRLNYAPLLVIDYGSGNTEGYPIQAVTSTSLQVYSSREAGMKFVSPANVSLNVIGVTSLVAKTGTPTGNLRYRIYTGSTTTPTLQGTTSVLAPAAVNTARALKTLYFSSPITISPNTTVRIVVSESTQSDTSGNRYTLEDLTLSSTDTGILVPYTTQPESTLSTDGGANFTDTSNRFVPIYLVLDASDPFTASSSGGASAYTFIG